MIYTCEVCRREFEAIDDAVGLARKQYEHDYGKPFNNQAKVILLCESCNNNFLMWLKSQQTVH